MNGRVIRRGFALLLADIVIIIGIFFLQFRTDSNKIEKLGNLQITLSETQNEENITVLNNKLQVSYNGVTFHCDDQTPLMALYKNEKEPRPLVLKSWEKNPDYSYLFTFDDDVKLYFMISDLTAEAKLSILTYLPDTIKRVYLPYNYSYTMNILSEESNRVIFGDKKNSWKLQGSAVGDGRVTFGDGEFVASYVIYNETEKFSFNTMVASLEEKLPVYKDVLENFKNTFISSFKATSEANYTEQSVVAYVAAMAEKGKYRDAVEEIPQSFKKSDKRTYLSAPYFNTLEAMNVTLDKSIKTVSDTISKSAEAGTLDIFAARDIASYMCIHSKPSEVYRIINSALNADISSLTLAQTAGIIGVFNDFCIINTEYAARLKPIMDLCVKRIESSCTFDGQKVVISENDTFVSVVQGVEIGAALLRYALFTNNQIYAKAGEILIESYLADISSFDLRTLTNLYPILCYENTYYPHFAKVNVDSSANWTWAWTCAKDIKYSQENANSVNITIEFPLEYTHYVILKGIPSFNNIYIYNMAFRTDPRFETYNSSGYVYKADTKTLLLKSRHKSEKEVVRLSTSEKMNSSKANTPAPVASSTEEKKPEETKAATEQTEAKKEEPKAETPAAKTETTETSNTQDAASTTTDNSSIQRTMSESERRAQAAAQAAAEANRYRNQNQSNQ